MGLFPSVFPNILVFGETFLTEAADLLLAKASKSVALEILLEILRVNR
jgi:hypothetical protein